MISLFNLKWKCKPIIFLTHYYDSANKEFKNEIENCCGNKLKNEANSKMLMLFWMGFIHT